jgi:hypothetical protein
VTTIGYDLPRDCPVTLEVFNILGQQVSVLVNENQKAGRRIVTWDAECLSSGIYYYRLTAEGFLETRKMVLQR